ncbi:MAG TPA: hypothetical protein VFE61_01955 [Candidatus Sulfotelmatobacter sp.]|nr:hypothetical protein [Candidatus Sulfotelmatobacter sp.]
MAEHISAEQWQAAKQEKAREQGLDSHSIVSSPAQTTIGELGEGVTATKDTSAEVTQSYLPDPDREEQRTI